MLFNSTLRKQMMKRWVEIKIFLNIQEIGHVLQNRSPVFNFY
ncbi:MAG: hypothetical protein JWQ34_1529 [Mucilaginibacter sp.]|nr:hypothetical protein [Mucilaginibacter sp.]